MASNVLSLEAPDTLNKCILRLVDTSIYNSQTTATCPLLQVTPPGFSYSVQFDDTVIQKGFILNLTACDLELQNDQCGTTYWDLPDGIYIIKYSVSPHDLVYVEYNHLRIVKALNRYMGIMCEIELGTCDPPAEIKDKLNKLTLIRRYLDAAKAAVEFCHEPRRGLELYKYAVKMLDKINCKRCK